MNKKLTKKLSHSVGKRPDLASQDPEISKNRNQNGSTLLTSAPLLDHLDYFRVCKDKNGYIEIDLPADLIKTSVEKATLLSTMILDACLDETPI